jgi:hypothetical protein
LALPLSRTAARGRRYAPRVNTLLHWLAAYGLGFAFLHVRVERLGLLDVAVLACLWAGLPVERLAGA